MRNQITENKEFFILSRSIDNAEQCKVIEVNEDCFKVKLNNPRKYETDETVELFSMTSNGQLYFETIVKEVENDVISIWFPITYKYLQRREYSRVAWNKIIKLKDGNNTTDANVIDISAGGMKVLTSQQLELLKEYNVSIEIENKNIETTFEPIRIECSSSGFISSVKYKNISNLDRIALVQYCFRKQIENSSK